MQELGSVRGAATSSTASVAVDPPPPAAGPGEPWVGFRARTVLADRAIAIFLLLAAPALLLGDRPETWTLFLTAMLATAAFVALPRLRAPVTTRLRRLWPRAFRHARSWYVIFAVPLLYMLVPVLNTAVHGGTYFDDVLIGWEQTLFGTQPSQRWADAAPWLPLSELLHAAYLSYYALIFVPAMLLHIRGRRRAFEAAVAIFAIVSLLHFLVFIYFPVQGPRYVFPPPTAGGIDDGWLYRLTHAILEGGSSQGAAFPSGHVAVAAAQTVVAARWLPRAFPWIAATSLLLALSTVYGGFHYLIDALVGGVAGALVATLVILRTDGG